MGILAGNFQKALVSNSPEGCRRISSIPCRPAGFYQRNQVRQLVQGRSGFEAKLLCWGIAAVD